MFEEKIALVTGASNGIGNAIAKDLASKGAKVIIHYNTDKKNAEKLASEINGIIFSANLVKETEVNKLISFVSKTTKKLDILVNNAGYFDESDGIDISAKAFQELMSVHVIAVQQLIAGLKNLYTADASIINVSSIHGMKSEPHALAYSASKAAVHSLTESFAKTLAPIRVNTVSPGAVWTPMWEGISKQEMKRIGDKSFLKRFGQPEEIAKAVSFLASNEASFITGTNLVVDGGRLIK